MADNKNEGEPDSEKKSDLVEVKWDFIKDELPDFQNGPVDKIRNWVERLTFLPRETLDKLAELINQVRDHTKGE